jgi:hypothetical protein
MANYLTQNDVENYGSELVNFAQRAAVHAVGPQLQNLEQQNAELRQRLAKEARHRLDAQVAAAVPEYQTIDRNPRWHRWLLEYDPLSGVVRQRLLDDAIASGSAARVVAFFRGYQQAARASGSQPGTGHAPRRTPSAASDKPTYTPAQIKQLYEQHRKGAYTGREAEWARIEADIFAAQREGRVQGAPYLTK